MIDWKAKQKQNKALLKGNKEARLKNYTRVKTAGYSYASKLEAGLHGQLLLEEKAGLITVEQVQDTIYLSEARIKYIADYRIFDRALGEHVWCESKGFENDRWPIIKKLWAFYGPGRLRIYKGSYDNIKLDEEIIPNRRGIETREGS